MRTLFLLLALITAIATAPAQNSSHKEAAAKALVKIFDKHCKYSGTLIMRKEPGLYALKVKLGAGNKVKEIIASDNAPADVIGEMTDPAIFSGYHWEQLLGRKTREGDLVIMPIVAISSDEPTSGFSPEKFEKQFIFQGRKSNFENCLLVQPYIIRYSGPVT
ncbi:MAG TPA: hypothetical protein VM802_01085 [Chitinophaga sp.]|uniref:hypothetical protein n=1 Tax=Chitinophaga sp. TaxID=1869181 RepID=UPI002BFC0602|nr:hypothetical protein [Chitinophaga sp.]HVI43426.1 hypothetical protein [Chitinophaga sp.]